MDTILFRFLEKQNLFEMNRRNFTKLVSASSLGVISGSSVLADTDQSNLKAPFKLNYAPHLGMFSHHAGNDPIDQLNFMADQGFRAFEDNDMRNRDVVLQKKIAETMIRRNLKMGVFVAHKIYWQKPNLANGDKKMRNEFLNYIKKAIPVAKRVNAKWVTVVPGHVDLKQNMAYQTANVIESLKQAAGLLEPHGIQAVASGTGKKHGVIEHTKEEYKNDINISEKIVYTSGLGGLFKPGIPVGKISKDSDNKINFFSDFTQLDYVKITSYDIGGKK